MTTVRHTNGDYLTTTTLPTMTGAFSIGGCLKNNAHSSGTEVTMFGLCNTGGSSEGIVLSTGLNGAGVLTALAFNAGGGNQVSRTVYTGSYTGWLYWLIRHKAGSASYQVSWRFENDTAWQTVTLTLPAQITVPSGQMRLGSSIFDLHATDCSSHHFYCKESYLTDTQALTASRALGTAPSGTNLHYLALTSAATAATNGGTAANWTPTGTLTDDASTPSESALPSTYYAGAGPVAYGSTSVQAVWPEDVGLAAGDYIDYVIGTKPDTATIASPGAGWTLVKETSGGGGTTGADAGPTKLAVYRLTALAAGTETGNGPAVAITSGNSSWAYMRVCRNDAGGGFSVAAGGGTDSTTGAAVSVTCDVDPGLQPDDVVLCSMVVPTDVTTPDQFSAYGVTATSVSAWSSFREINEPDSTTGNDIGGFSFWGRVVTGTSSAAPVIGATAGGTTTNVRGPAILSRVRGLSSAVTSTGSAALAAFALAASCTVTPPAVTSSGTAAVAPFDASGSGATGSGAVTASGSAALSAFGSSAAAAEAFTASGSAALSAFGASGAADLFVPAPLQVYLPGPVVPGEFNRRLPPFWPPSEIPRSTVILQQLVDAGGSVGLSAFGAAGLATVSFAASGSAAASAFGAAASGSESFAASGSSALSAFAVSGAAAAGLVCSGSAAVLPFAAASAGAEAFSGAGSAAAQAFAAAGAGAEAFTATASAACQPFGASGSAAQGTVFTSAGSAAAQSFAATSTATETLSGTGAAACQPFGSSSAGDETFSGSGSAATQPFGSAGNAAQGTVFTSAASAALAPFSASGAAAGQDQVTSAGSAASAPFGVAGASDESFAGSAALGCSPFAVTGDADNVITNFIATGVAALAAFGLSADVAELLSCVAAADMQPFSCTNVSDRLLWPSLPRQSATAHAITRLQVTAPAITRQRAVIRSS